ncbi:methyltransferase domain-containing protein [Streptomyces sp. N35]|uniref:methyltransferase domain-containing protein n=1 Tax=Streptomyces sp. N35 TaxID=2795730 RepID=UPI0027DC8BEA|nr:methyltransferase domain-containing protein [Streptomyces sp. N35]
MSTHPTRAESAHPALSESARSGPSESAHPTPPDTAHGQQPGQDPVPELIALLDALDAMPVARRLRGRTYDLLEAGPGSRIVDAGCGAGRAGAGLTETGARATRVALRPRVLHVARERCPKGDFREGDLAELPFGDATLDGYRADKVLHTLPDPARAVAEAARVLVSGGRAVLVGQDWDTLVIDSGDPALTRTIVQARADLTTSPRAARAHRALLLDAGFTEIGVEVHTAVFTGGSALPLLTGVASAAHEAGAVTADEAGRRLAHPPRGAAADRFFVAIPMFLAVGTKP